MKSLTELAEQIQFPPDFESRSSALTALVKSAMRTRTICRPRQGQSLEGIYLEIFQTARQQMRCQFERAIDNYNPQLMPVRDWLISVRDGAFQEALEPDVLEQLAVKAQSCSCQNQDERRYALTELINALRISGKLLSQGRYPSDIYHDAVNQTLLFVAQNVDAYNPQKGRFIAWVNYRFSKILREVQKEIKDPFFQSINALLVRKKYRLTALIDEVGKAGIANWLEMGVRGGFSQEYSAGQITLMLCLMAYLYRFRQNNKKQANLLLLKIAESSLDCSISFQEDRFSPIPEDLAVREEIPCLSERVREYFITDPEGLCQKSIASHPKVTFQAIALAYLEGKQWQEISSQFKLGISAVKNFFWRYFKSISPSIKRYIQLESV